MSDTPEIDAVWKSSDTIKQVMTSRRLERERDEARDTLTTIHRWIERNHPDGFIDSQSFSQNLERVTDRWYERLDQLERERDEAIAQRDEQVRLTLEVDRLRAQAVRKLAEAQQQNANLRRVAEKNIPCFKLLCELDQLKEEEK